MAAILCHGVKELCGTGCNKLASLPCCAAEGEEEEEEVEPTLFQRYCRCGNCCGGGKYLKALQHICTNPFGIFVTVTVVSNIPPMIIALTELSDLGFGADATVCFASIWLLVNFLFCWVHIIASFYIAISINYHRIQQQQQQQEKDKARNNKQKDLLSLSPDRTIFRRASNLFCYDPALAIYIMTVCVYVGYVFVPKLFHLDDPNNESNLDGTCNLYIHEKVVATVGFAWAFLGFGMGALGLSFGFAYVDATRQPRNHKKGPVSRYDQDTFPISGHFSELETDGSVYTNMEEGNTDGSGSGDHIKKNRDSSSGSPFALGMEQYVPPMITYDDDNNNGIELVSDGDDDESKKSKRVHDTLNKVMMSDNSNDDNTSLGLVTDLDDTDLETDIEGRTSLDTADQDYAARHRHSNHRNNRNNRGPKVTVSYFEDDEDQQPVTSYEVQDEEEEETESTNTGGSRTEGFETDRYMGGGETTDAGAQTSFGSTDIDQAIDLTDTEAAAFNLDRVMAVSHDDEPTVSMSFDPLEASGDDTDSITAGGGSIGESIASLVNSITGSIGTRDSTRDGGSTSTGGNGGGNKRGKKPSFRNTRELANIRITTPTDRLLVAGKKPLKKATPRTPPPASNRAQRFAAAGPYDSPPQDPGVATAMDINQQLEPYYSGSYNDAPLTYSTSIGTIVGPVEPLSFVDGGGAASNNANNDISPRPRSMRFATTTSESDDKPAKRKRGEDVPRSPKRK